MSGCSEEAPGAGSAGVVGTLLEEPLRADVPAERVAGLLEVGSAGRDRPLPHPAGTLAPFEFGKGGLPRLPFG